ncbi:hypothetical protein ACJX0J_020825, partial [Zea mays]
SMTLSIGGSLKWAHVHSWSNEFFLIKGQNHLEMQSSFLYSIFFSLYINIDIEKFFWWSGTFSVHVFARARWLYEEIHYLLMGWALTDEVEVIAVSFCQFEHRICILSSIPEQQGLMPAIVWTLFLLALYSLNLYRWKSYTSEMYCFKLIVIIALYDVSLTIVVTQATPTKEASALYAAQLLSFWFNRICLGLILSILLNVLFMTFQILRAEGLVESIHQFFTVSLFVWLLTLEGCNYFLLAPIVFVLREAMSVWKIKIFLGVHLWFHFHASYYIHPSNESFASLGCKPDCLFSYVTTAIHCNYTYNMLEFFSLIHVKRNGKISKPFLHNNAFVFFTAIPFGSRLIPLFTHWIGSGPTDLMLPFPFFSFIISLMYNFNRLIAHAGLFYMYTHFTASVTSAETQYMIIWLKAYRAPVLLPIYYFFRAGPDLLLDQGFLKLW